MNESELFASKENLLKSVLLPKPGQLFIHVNTLARLPGTTFSVPPWPRDTYRTVLGFKSDEFNKMYVEEVKFK